MFHKAYPALNLSSSPHRNTKETGKGAANITELLHAISCNRKGAGQLSDAENNTWFVRITDFNLFFVSFATVMQYCCKTMAWAAS
jgi:hypothetical protein